MKKLASTLVILFFTVFLSLNVQNAFSQVVISGSSGATPDGSAMLDIQSTDKGLLIPRMDSTSRKSILNPAEGLLVYDSDYQSFFIYGKTAKGTAGWIDLSSTAGIWTRTDNNVYLSNTAYNVGIGTSTPTKKLVIKAENSQDTLLEVQDMNGNPLMVITPQMTKFNIVTGNKGVAGGFAVGRYTGAKATNEPLFSVTPDSTRVYTLTAAGVAGGFAVGRYTGAKGAASTSFYTDADSTRVYTGGPTKGVAGGFAVGRYTGAKAGSGNYMYMVPDNYFIGDQSGEALQNSYYSGKYNTFFGYQAGMSDTIGGSNVFIGYKSGLNNKGVRITSPVVDTLGSRNVFLGYEAGLNNTDGSDNVLLGYKAGHEITTAGNNISIGSEAGLKNTNNSDNIFIGRNAGYNHIGTGIANEANNNIYIGLEAGYGDSIVGSQGRNNIFIGDESGRNNKTGNNNVFLGLKAGLHNSSGQSNVFLGEGTGENNTSGKYNIYVGLGAGQGASASSTNTCIGYNSGNFSGLGDANTFLGSGAGYSSSGKNNVMIGHDAGFDGETGDYNVFIGPSSGYVCEGSKNILIGYGTGGFDNTISGDNNIFIGQGVGTEIYGSNILMINNAADPTPLIYGEFDRGYLQINDTLNIAGEYNMPSVKGTAGQVLITNGTDAAYWSSTANLDNDWTVSGNNMYSAVSGNVGIGTTSPAEKLEVKGDVIIGSGSVGYDGSSEHIQIAAQNDSWYLGVRNESYVGGSDFFIGQGDLEDGIFHIKNNGDVGIGTYSPASNTKLHVLLSGSALASQYYGTVACFQRNSSTSDFGRISIISGTAGNSLIDFGDADSQDVGGIRYSNQYNMMLLRTNGADRVTIDNSGNVNILNGGDATISGDATIIGNTATGSINVNSGTTIKKIQAGTATIGPSIGTAYFKEVIITFPTAFSSTPKIVCTARTATGYSYNDVFVITTKSISTTQFTVNVLRVDSNSSWAQNLLMDWYAWEQ